MNTKILLLALLLTSATLTASCAGSFADVSCDSCDSSKPKKCTQCKTGAYESLDRTGGCIDCSASYMSSCATCGKYGCLTCKTNYTIATTTRKNTDGAQRKLKVCISSAFVHGILAIMFFFVVLPLLLILCCVGCICCLFCKAAQPVPVNSVPNGAYYPPQAAAKPQHQPQAGYR